MVYLEIAIVVVLICVNGLLAMSELAIVSARPARLKAMIDRKVSGAGRALALGANPGRFLSTVQIGITLVGVLSGAFSGATLGDRLADILVTRAACPARCQSARRRHRRRRHHLPSLIIGELVPKQIALRNPEGIAAHGRADHDHPLQGRHCRSSGCSISPAARCFWLLGQSRRERGKGDRRGDQDAGRRSRASRHHRSRRAAHDRRRVCGSATAPCARHDAAHRDRLARTSNGTRTICEPMLMETQHSRLPVGEGDVDAMIGVVQTRELLAAAARRPSRSRSAQLCAHGTDRARPGRRARRADDAAANAEVPMALVHDEYGHFEGIVTPADILEAITGVFRSDVDEGRAAIRAARGRLVAARRLHAGRRDGRATRHRTARRTATTRRSPASSCRCSTACRRPAKCVDAQGYRFEVVDLDGRRIDKVIASRLPGVHRRRQDLINEKGRLAPPPCHPLGPLSSEIGLFTPPALPATSSARAVFSTFAHQARSSSAVARGLVEMLELLDLLALLQDLR